MDSSIRLLGVVPYEGMKTLLLRLAEEYPQIRLDVFVGNMEEGVEIARSNLGNRYDAVISRGGTALALRELPLPVVEIELSLYDILYALRLSNGLHSKLAMVAYANVTVSAQALCDLLNYQVDIFTVDAIGELEPTLRRLKEDRYDAVLCDVTADIIARSIGLNTIFISSGLDSIRQALDKAVALCRSQKRLRDENALFRALLSGQDTQVAVFDQEKELAFFQGGDRPPELLSLLRRELDELPEGKERRITRGIGGTLYNLRVRPVSADRAYTAVYFSARRTAPGKNQTGIRCFSRQEAERRAFGSIFNFQNVYDLPGEETAQLAAGMAPVLITGEEGIRMSRAAARLYLEGGLQDAPLISINCCLLNDKGWEFLLESHNSPLAESGSTLYFSRVGALSPARRLQLADMLAEAGVCRRSKVLLSCVCRPGEQMAPEGAGFLDRLNCRILHLRPLPAGADPRADQLLPEPSERLPPLSGAGRRAGGGPAAAVLPVASQLRPVPAGDRGAGRVGPAAHHRRKRPRHPPEGAVRQYPHLPERRYFRAPGPESDAGQDRPGCRAARSGRDQRQPVCRRQAAGYQPHHPAPADQAGVMSAARVSGFPGMRAAFCRETLGDQGFPASAF